MLKIDLNGSWRMKRTDDAAWLPAEVPGSVASDLIRAGRMDDPYYRDRQYEVFEAFRHNYEYEREFELDSFALQADKVELRCDGLDTIAELELNGVAVGSTMNMHRTYRFDVKNAARIGRNSLRIVFRSAVEYVEQKQEERYLWAANGDYVVQGYPHLRKAHHMFGWDWGPKLPDSGIWRDISIEAYNAGRLQDVYISQEHRPDGAVTLDVRVEADLFGQDELTAEVDLKAPNGVVVASGLQVIGAEQKHIRVQVEKPELWWPNGLGAQPLYALQVVLKREGVVVDERLYRIGLRTLTVKQEPDQWGETFEFVVNGVSIFTMGANYIPEDNVRDRHSRERTERLVRDCVQANFNCIRVWGGGFYPDDYFFDLCDEYGLIVWQDHLFACAEYEMTESFTAEIVAEVTDNVKRLRHHASLGLWCGNNEMEQAWLEWDFPKRPKLRTDYVKQFELILPELTQALDPNTFYWKASPSSGGGFDDPNAPDRGDVHFWEVWHGGKPFTEYRKHYFRFCSEFGFQSFPALKTIESFTEPGDRNIFTPIMESHQKNPAGNGKILFGISENFLYPKDFDSLLYVSQLLQAEAMRYGVEHWRRNRGRCMGSVYWQLNDCWPVASWSSIDYFGRWKALHYSAKRFYAPVLLSAEEEGTQVKLAVTNDTLQVVEGEIRWRLCDRYGAVVQEGTIRERVEPLSAKSCAELDFAELLGAGERRRKLYFEYSLLVDGVVVSDGIVLFVKPKHFAFVEPNLRVTVTEESDRYMLDVHCDAFAMFVELDFADRDARFSDNYFAVSGETSKRIELRKEDLSQLATAEELHRALRVRSLIDSYRC